MKDSAETIEGHLTDSPATSVVFSSWLTAIRPKTLTAAIVPFGSGTAYAAVQGVEIHWRLFIYALLSAICIQIATNFINDAFDYKRGADNKDRLGPKRAIQNGVATPQEMLSIGLTVFFIAFLLSVPLIFHGGWGIALVILISILSGYCYTGGAKPLAYSGLGDAFVILFFGWVSTAAAFWLQKETLDWSVFLLGTQIGLLCTLMIAINNLRDVHGDHQVGKMTIPVRYGIFYGKAEIVVLAFFPYFLSILWFVHGYFYAGLLPLLTIPLAVILSAKVWTHAPSPAYNGFLGLAALLHILFGACLVAGFLLQ